MNVITVFLSIFFHLMVFLFRDDFSLSHPTSFDTYIIAKL